MSLITITSDFGYNDPFVGTVKGKILSKLPEARIIDISHEIKVFNVAHGAYVLRESYESFPKGTIHIAAIDIEGRETNRVLAVEINEHIFIGPDNGIFSLLNDNKFSTAVELLFTDNNDSIFSSTFLPALVKIYEGENLLNLGNEVKSVKALTYSKARVVDNQIMGSVVHIDRYGNLATNVSKEIIQNQVGDNPFSVSFSGEVIEEVDEGYKEKDDGDCVVTFNDAGNIQIAIVRGNASNLLWMKVGSPVIISF